MKLTITLEDSNCLVHRFCYTCGAWFRPGEVSIRLGDDVGGNFGDICEQCLKSGPNTGMRERVRQQIKHLKAEVASLEELAEAPPIDAPTCGSYEKMVKEQEQKFLESLSPEDQASLRGSDEREYYGSAVDFPF